MKKVTLCFCVKDISVLLGLKSERARFGANTWNGYGGEVNEGETAKCAAVRELQEESGLTAQEKDLEQVARIDFFFGKVKKFTCYVYILRTWTGEPVPTDEMSQHQWFQFSMLPFDNMMVADKVWVPLILKGEKIKAKVTYNEDASHVDVFQYEPTEFN